MATHNHTIRNARHDNGLTQENGQMVVFSMHGKTLALLLIAVICSISIVSATYTYTFVSSGFNDATNVTEACPDTAFTNGFRAVIMNRLVYNDTSDDTSEAHITFGNGTTIASDDIIELWMTNDSKIIVKVNIDGKGTETILSSTDAVFLDGADTISIWLDTNGLLNVGNGTDADAYVEDFAFGNLNMSVMGIRGTTDYTADSGYVSIRLTTSYGGDVSGSMMQWIPIIIEFAMLGMILGLLKKVTR